MAGMKKGTQQQGEGAPRRYVSAFEENLKRYALVTRDNRINVWDTAAGSLRVQCFSSTPTTAKQFNHQYTCIAWGKSTNKTAKGERGGANDVAVGTHSGAVHIWDLLTSEVVLSLGEKGEGHVGAVNDVVFHNQGGAAGVTLYSCGADGQVVQWDLRNKNVALKWRANDTGVARIAVHTSQAANLIATADASIKVWDLASQKTLIKFVAERVTNLQFTHDGNYLLSSGSDRIINMWSCRQQDISANKTNAIKAFSCDSVPTTLTINRKKQAKALYHFLALSEGGAINVFEANLQDKAKGIAPASSIIRLEQEDKDAKKEKVSAGKTPIISYDQHFVDVNFYDAKEVIIVVGPETSPSFQRINYVNDDGTFTKQINVPRKHGEAPAIKQVNKKQLTVLEPTSIPPPNVVEGAKKKQKTEKTIASLDAKKISEIEQKARDTLDDNITFQAALEQAIHTNDQQLLTKCLTIHNYETVKSTLVKLAPSFIIPLVKIMINLLHTASHHQALYSYLHIIVNNHTALLMSSGALRECSALYSSLNARAASYLELLKSKGRIDLLLAHLDKAQAPLIVDATPKNVFKEVEAKGEEEEGSEDEGEDEEKDSEEEGEDKGEEGEAEGEEEGDESFIKLNGKGGDSEESGEEEDDDSTHKRKRDETENGEDGEEEEDED